jgi:hypothetical protein
MRSRRTRSGAQPARPGRSARRGSIYVVATSGLVMVGSIGLAAMAILRVDHQTHMAITQTSELRLLAQSGLELAVQRVVDEPNWRAGYRPNVGWMWKLGEKQIRVTITDPDDGNLADSRFDPIVITSWASDGDARQGVRAGLRMHESAGPVYNYAIAATGNVTVRAVTPLEVTGEGVYTAGTFAARNSTIVRGDVDAGATAGLFEGSTTSGKLTNGVAAIPFPDIDDAFSTWTRKATMIDPNKLIDGYKLIGVTLSPTENPYGKPDPDGIYHIHVERSTLHLENVTLVGTLIVTGLTGDLDIRESTSFSPVDPSLPVLMIQASRVDVRGGSTTTAFNGLTLIDGGLNVASPVSGSGPILVNGSVTMDVGGAVRIKPTGAVASSPPEAFSTFFLPVLIDRSWERVTD